MTKPVIRRKKMIKSEPICMTAIVASAGNDRTRLWRGSASLLRSGGYLLMPLGQLFGFCIVLYIIVY